MPTLLRFFLTLLLAGLAPPRHAGRDVTRPFTPTEAYETRAIEGWEVLVNGQFLAQAPDVSDATLRLLADQLREVARRVPACPLAKLRTVRIWVEEAAPEPVCMAYHPNPEWLREHGMNPEKARCVDIGNSQNFLKWSHEQPWMVFHELAHAYHHRFLAQGFDNPEVRRVFQSAMKSHRYESVPRVNGRRQRAYATTNPMEYFAESSEAFFGKNDFYPFDSDELKRHDPKAYDLLRKLWEQK